MGVINASAMLSGNTINSHNNIPDELIESNISRMSYKLVRNELNTANYMTQITQPNAEDSTHIKALKDDIVYFQCMIDQMAQLSSEKMDCCISLLKTSKSLFDNNYHFMHKKYVELLNKTQAFEAKNYLRVLKSE